MNQPPKQMHQNPNQNMLNYMQMVAGGFPGAQNMSIPAPTAPQQNIMVGNVKIPNEKDIPYQTRGNNPGKEEVKDINSKVDDLMKS